MAGKSRIYKLDILADTKNLNDGLKKAQSIVDDSSSKMGDAFKKVGIAIAAVGAAAGAYAIALGKASIQEAIQAEAENNRLATILKNTGATNEQIEALNQQADALERVGVVSGGNIKVVQSQLATFDLSAAAIQRLTPAILDYVTAEKGANASAEDFRSATNGLAQALNGNFASLTKTGFVLDETTKAQISNGTEAERAAAIVEVLNSTYEGFNETLTETAEGRLIQLRNNFDQIKTRIGEVLLPVLRDLTEFIVAKILPVIDRFVASFEKNASPAMNKIRDIIEKFVLPAMQNLWKFIKDFFYPTIRNILVPVIEILRAAFDFLRRKIDENREGFVIAANIMERIFIFVRDNLAPVIGNVLSTAFNLITRAIGFAIEGFNTVFKIINSVAKFLGFDFSLEVGKATKAVNNLDSGIVDAYKSFNEQSKTVKENVIPGLLDFGAASLKAADGQNKLAGSAKAATAALQQQSALQKELAALQAGGVAPPTISKDLARFYRSELGLISEFGGKIEGINLLPTDPFYGFGKGGNVGQAIQQRQSGSATATGGTTIINVNGTVVDPEGAARAIQSVIQKSAGRAGNISLVPAIGLE